MPGRLLAALTAAWETQTLLPGVTGPCDKIVDKASLTRAAVPQPLTFASQTLYGSEGLQHRLGPALSALHDNQQKELLVVQEAGNKFRVLILHVLTQLISFAHSAHGTQPSSAQVRGCARQRARLLWVLHCSPLKQGTVSPLQDAGEFIITQVNLCFSVPRSGIAELGCCGRDVSALVVHIGGYSWARTFPPCH